MTTKAELKILETIYAMEIERAIEKTAVFYQKDTKLTKKLIEDGLIEWFVDKQETPQGLVTVKHLELTLLGNFVYCSSCRDKD